MKTDVLIIGAGLSGLVLALSLKKSSILLEKSRGVGGRLATRRVEGQAFDHGALYLPDDPKIRSLLTPQFAYLTNEKGLFVEGGMTKLPKELGKDLSIRKSTRAEYIERTPLGWRVKTDTGEEFDATVLVITAPLPQALELLHKSTVAFSPELYSINYIKGLIALIMTKEVVSLDGGQLPSSLHSIEPMTPRGLHPRGFVVRMSPSTSEEYFEKKDPEILDRLVEDFKKCFSSPPTIEYQELKKWRYVTPEKSLPIPFLELNQSLFLIGDSFITPDARGSVYSALALAEKLNLAF
jgi:renalase